jgi:putative ABC transport system permease protein
LKNVTLGFLDGLDQQIRIVDGTAPRPAARLDLPVEVLLAYPLANQVGINVGDEFQLVSTVGSRVISMPVQVAGLWQPVERANAAWFFSPDAFNDVMLVHETTFTGPVAALLKGEVGQVAWFAQLSGAHLTSRTALPLLSRIEAIRAQITSVVPGLRLEQGVAEALEHYQTSAASLTLHMVVFSVPILALVLYFAALVATLLVQRQRGEIALLKTRGVRDLQIVGIYAVEWMILGASALVIGSLLGLLFAQLMGRTRSFLQLAADAPPLPIDLTWTHLRFGLIVVVLALMAALIPALSATRTTLVDEQQQVSRMIRRPFWQRWYLDWILLLPPIYGLYQLRRSGGLQLGAASGADPLGNPLLMVVPVLLCCALGLIAIRLIPRLLELLAWLTAVPSWTVPLIALRSLARQPSDYRGPLLLLILTLSLASFSASMAATLDGALQHAISYEIGAMTQLLETGESTAQTQSSSTSSQHPQLATRTNIEQEARFLFVPVTAHLDVPGIEAATRVGSYQATIQLGRAKQTAQLVGIDRIDLPKTLNQFDPQWAHGQSLGSLMNLLAHPKRRAGQQRCAQQRHQYR